MLLGKRARPPMKRNTSMTEFTVDFTHVSSQPSDPPLVHHRHQQQQQQSFFSPVNRRAADYDDNFLRSCSLCKRRLIPGHDIYMYRGDSGFCSQECRQQQIIDDERKEKFLLASRSKLSSTNGETSTVTAL